MEAIEPEAAMMSERGAETADDRDLQLWLKLGRGAFFFCLWAAMILPVALIVSFRF
jgi:hypothetical protein